MTDISLIGLLIGFGCTGVFLIFAIVNIIVDEAERHEKFKAKVTEAKKTLTDDYDVEEKEMDEIDAEFEEKEKKGDKKDDKAEREELAEINWARMNAQCSNAASHKDARAIQDLTTTTSALSSNFAILPVLSFC